MIINDERDLLFVYKKTLEVDGIKIPTFDNPIMVFQEFKEYCFDIKLRTYPT